MAQSEWPAEPEPLFQPPWPWPLPPGPGPSGVPWVPTIQCRNGWWAANTPTPARWGPPWAPPLRGVPTCAVIAALRNGVARRCHCLPGRCQGKLGTIELGWHQPAWWWGTAWPFPVGIEFFRRYPWLMLVNQDSDPTPLSLSGSDTLPGGTRGLVLVSNATAGPITVTLPPGTAGQRLIVKDAAGNAGTHPITILCHPTVDGLPSYLLASDFASISLYWMGAQWGTL